MHARDEAAPRTRCRRTSVARRQRPWRPAVEDWRAGTLLWAQATVGAAGASKRAQGWRVGPGLSRPTSEDESLGEPRRHKPTILSAGHGAADRIKGSRLRREGVFEVPVAAVAGAWVHREQRAPATGRIQVQ